MLALKQEFLNILLDEEPPSQWVFVIGPHLYLPVVESPGAISLKIVLDRAHLVPDRLREETLVLEVRNVPVAYLPGSLLRLNCNLVLRISHGVKLGIGGFKLVGRPRRVELEVGFSIRVGFGLELCSKELVHLSLHFLLL
jgi:hypothetical protein